MSRIGKKALPIPKEATCTIKDGKVFVKGPKGELDFSLPNGISYEVENGILTFSRHSEEKHTRSLHGMTRAMVASMVEGVTKGFTKSLDIEGVGFKAEMRGKNLYLLLGYSHPILVIPPPGITFAAGSPTQISVTGINKQLVGEVAAKIREIRPPEPYKGKGVRYSGEHIVRKAGKSGSK